MHRARARGSRSRTALSSAPATITGRVPMRAKSCDETLAASARQAVTGRYAAPAWIGEQPSTSCMYRVRKKNMA